MESQPQSTLLPSAPPAYTEKQQFQQQAALVQRNQSQGYQPRGPGLQAWPQGYPVGTQYHYKTILYGAAAGSYTELRR